MSKPPYPGFNPNFKSVPKLGGYTRTCFVVQFLSDGLSSSAIAVIQEQLEGTVDRLTRSMASIEKGEVVTPDRFDTLLREGLRLP